MSFTWHLVRCEEGIKVHWVNTFSGGGKPVLGRETSSASSPL